MKIFSPAFQNGQPIPAKYTCDGENVSPPFAFFEVPPAAKSLALIVDDPDAPSGNFVHWVVWNIGPHMKEIAEGSVPAGTMEGMTGFGKPGYGGPCPPSGEHHYFFKLYALDSLLNLPAGTGKAALEKAMEGHILEKTELVGLYAKNQRKVLTNIFCRVQ